MQSIAELQVDDHGQGGIYAIEIADERSEQVIAIESDKPLAGYNLEAVTWAEGERHPDGVVIGEHDGMTWVCFIELKTSMKQKTDKQDPSERAFSQLAGGVSHFHPVGRGTTGASHGAEHHDAWTRGIDHLDVMPAKDHRVLGIAVGFRQVPRPPPTTVVNVGTMRVRLAAVQISGSERNRATTTFDHLLRRAGAIR